MQSRYIFKQDPRMQSSILHRDTIVETRVDVLVFAHGPRLRSTSTAHGISGFGVFHACRRAVRVVGLTYKAYIKYYAERDKSESV